MRQEQELGSPLNEAPSFRGNYSISRRRIQLYSVRRDS
jgi:hypothetical protein